MTHHRKILAINGSASRNSSNSALLSIVREWEKPKYDVTIIDTLSDLPHFATELTDSNVPEQVVEFRNRIAEADGIIICTPEYIFSVPSRLKNAIEWCVSTTVFSDKPLGIITASASGAKGHEELQLIMRTVQAVFTNETTLLISGVKGKVSLEGKITDALTEQKLLQFVQAFNALMEKHGQAIA